MSHMCTEPRNRGSVIDNLDSWSSIEQWIVGSRPFSGKHVWRPDCLDVNETRFEGFLATNYGKVVSIMHICGFAFYTYFITILSKWKQKPCNVKIWCVIALLAVHQYWCTSCWACGFHFIQRKKKRLYKHRPFFLRPVWKLKMFNLTYLVTTYL